jgi:hypothetical protein
VNIGKGKAREKRVAVKRVSVFACDTCFAAVAFVEREVARGESVVKFERSGYLACDVPVAAARHAVIGFGQQQDVSRAQRLIFAQRMDDRVESFTAFDVPCSGANERSLGCVDVFDGKIFDDDSVE